MFVSPNTQLNIGLSYHFTGHQTNLGVIHVLLFC